MTVSVKVVHPTVVIVESGERRFELPISCFPYPPQENQTWTITLDHEPTEKERITELNKLLPRQ